jgi:hypothetical protein
MGALLADIMRQWQAETPYPKPQDWVFPSFKLRGSETTHGFNYGAGLLASGGGKSRDFN